MIKKILIWSVNNENFDTKFVLSVQQNFKKYGRLTDKQKDAIENIYEKFVKRQ